MLTMPATTHNAIHMPCCRDGGRTARTQGAAGRRRRLRVGPLRGADEGDFDGFEEGLTEGAARSVSLVGM